MMKSKEKNNLNLNNLTPLTIAIPTESSALNLIKTLNLRILFTVADGILHLLRGILESESPFKMYMAHSSEETVFRTAEWIY